MTVLKVRCGNCGHVFYERDPDLPRAAGVSAAHCNECGWLGLVVEDRGPPCGDELCEGCSACAGE